MGLYVDTPQAPNPNATAAAQTSSNVNTAIANTAMGNADEISPTGGVRYTQIGQQQVSDGNGGFIDAPRYQRETYLSPEQQRMYDQQTRLGEGMNNLAIGQVDRLQNVLNRPIDTSGLTPAVTGVRAGKMQTGFDAGGPIRSSVGLNTNAPTTFGQTAQPLQYGISPTSTNVQTSVGANDFSQDRDKVEAALMSRLQPQMDRDREALSSRLANQGVVQGSQAWNTAMDQMNRSATDARMQAVLAGGQEQSRMFGMDLNKGQFANAAQAQEFGQNATRQGAWNAAQGQDFGQQQGRGLFEQTGIAQNNAAAMDEANFGNQAQQQQYDQNRDQANFYNSGTQQNFQNDVTAGSFVNDARSRALQEMLSLRNQPINEIGALMSGGQVSMPQFQQFNPGSVDSTPIGQYINQGYQTQAQQAAASNSAIAGLFGSIGGAATRGLFASDIRLKTDIERIGTWPNGLPYYGYNYKAGGPRQVGFMAHEVKEYMPDAVEEIDGYMHVNYSKAVH